MQARSDLKKLEIDGHPDLTKPYIADLKKPEIQGPRLLVNVSAAARSAAEQPVAEINHGRIGEVVLFVPQGYLHLGAVRARARAARFYDLVVILPAWACTLCTPTF